jgi:hypothetical protein
MGRKRQRYIGPFIPIKISRPIRAGLLYGVDHTELLSLITGLLIPDFPGPEDDSMLQREERARLYVAVVSGYTVPELADNCFWGDAIVSTKKRPPKRKRNDQGVKDHQLLSPIPKYTPFVHRPFQPSIGADGVDDGSAPGAAGREPGPSPETADSVTAGADDAAAFDREPVGQTVDAITAVTAVVEETFDDTPNTITETCLVLHASSADTIRGHIRTNENPCDDGPLTDPKTWQKVIDRCFRNNQSLTHLWKEEVAPRVGIPCPIGRTYVDLKAGKIIAPRLKAFGIAMKPYYETNDSLGIKRILDTLCTCNFDNIRMCAVFTEQYLKLAD